MKKILPLNDKPDVTSYVQHSYPTAIVQNDNLFSIYIKNFSKDNWKIITEDIEWNQGDNTDYITLKDSKDRKSDTFCIENNTQMREIILCINNIKIMDHLACVKVLINDSKSQNENNLFSMKWNQYDININECLIAHDNHLYAYYKISLENNKINVFISEDQILWELIKEENITISDAYIRVELFFGDNQYRAWKNMNYLQLFFNELDSNTVYLDYFMYPRKGWDASYNCMSHFLDTEYIDCSCLDEEKIIKYVIDSINSDYYLNISFDEFYIEGKHSYNRMHFEHYNLVYGYDDDTRLFYLFGYRGGGKLAKTTVSYDNFLKAYGKNNVVRYKLCYNSVVYKFNIAYVKQVLNEYLNSLNSSTRFSGIMTQRDGTYGLSIFKAIKEKGRSLLVNDHRISYLLCEHCRIMKERLEYLQEYGYTDASSADILAEKCADMLNYANLLKNLVVKHYVKPQYEDDIFVCFDNLYEKELSFYRLLLQSIKE